MISPETTRLILLAGMAVITVGLFIKKFKPTAVFALVTILLSSLGIIPIKDLLGHLANESILTIFLLVFITSSLKEHFNLIGLLDKLFKGLKSPRMFLLGFTSLVSSLSAFVNNTPIVAVFIPYIYSWTKKRKLSPSKFLIPLSFAATLGGTITLIGTSTNLVLNGLMTSNGYESFSFFDFFVPGLMVTVGGLILLISIGYWLLPEHKDLLDDFENEQRQYIMELLLPVGSTSANKTVAQAQLRNLEGVYLVEINRENQLISPVAPSDILLEGDLLYFAGDTSKVAELANNSKYGFVFPKTEKFNLGKDLDLVEALIPAMSNLGGVKVKNSNFRERYDAAIVAVQRDGARLGGKIGDLQLQYGDLLLLTAGKEHRKKMQTAKNLYSLSSVVVTTESNKGSKLIFALIAVAAIFAISFNALSFFIGLLIMQFSLFALGLASFDQLKKQFNPDLYIILVSAIAFGTALVNTGTAVWITDHLLVILQNASPRVIAISLFFTTVLVTSFVTNVAAVSIMFPITAALLPQLQMEPTQAFLMLAFGASCSFLTPVSYQTNIMVYEPGGYNSIDFLKIGLPLTIVYSLICIAYFT